MSFFTDFFYRFSSLGGMKGYTPKAGANMLRKAKKSIRIIAPDAESPFLRDSRLLGAVYAAVNKGVRVQVAHWPRLMKGSSALMNIVGVEYFLVDHDKPERAMIVVDGKRLIIFRKPSLWARDVAVILTRGIFLAREKYDDFNWWIYGVTPETV